MQVLSIAGGNGQGTAQPMTMWQTGQQADAMKGSHGIEHPVHVLPVVAAVISMTARHWRGSTGERPFREKGRMKMTYIRTSYREAAASGTPYSCCQWWAVKRPNCTARRRHRASPVALLWDSSAYALPEMPWQSPTPCNARNEQVENTAGGEFSADYVMRHSVYALPEPPWHTPCR